MNQVQNELMHFGVLGMKWGHRTAKAYDKKADKSLAKANILDKKGKTEAASIKRENAAIFKQRAKNAKEIGNIGEKIKQSSTLVDKLLGRDLGRMNIKLAKGKYTRGELLATNILNGSRYTTMRSLASAKLING